MSRERQKVTLKDVSKASGLSLITVSRALREPATVRADTRAKVQRTIDELGYIPNLAARSLVSQRTDMIGVVVPILASSLFAEFTQGLSRVLEPKGIQMLLAVSDWSAQQEEDAVKTFIARQADALIVTGFTHSQTTQKLLSNFHGPVVETWNLSDSALDIAVGYSNYQAAVDMTNHLIQRGYREIVMVGGDRENNDQLRDRYDGFCNAMRKAGRPINPDTIVTVSNPTNIESGAPIIQDLLARKKKPDAVFFQADLPAHGAMLWCLSNGIRVPDDVAIAGFGDLNLSSLLPIQMTTVRIKAREIGENTGHMVLRRLEGGANDTSIKDLGFELKIREST